MSGSNAGWMKRAALVLWPGAGITRTEKGPIEYGGWVFSTPLPFFHAHVPPRSGLFVVQVGNWSWSLQGFEPIYFGESDNLYRRLLVKGDDDFVTWLMQPRAVHGLFVSVLPTPMMRKAERKLAENHLMRQYELASTRSLEEYLRGFHRPATSGRREPSPTAQG